MIAAIEAVTIGRGLIFLAPKVAESNLGSCLGIALSWPEEGRFGLAHCLLPSRDRDPGDTRYYRYADTAPRFLLKRMGVPPERRSEVRACLAGGAELFEGSRQGVGASNVKAGVGALRELGVRIRARDVGGQTARRMRVDAKTGLVTVIQMDGPQGHREIVWRVLR
ncbi:MAG: chemotaxis protein CheD [Myxococcota bacterium]|nr:chemotaxis protein CheD [Myxococcota bacterium]